MKTKIDLNAMIMTITEAFKYLTLDKATAKTATSLVENKRRKIYATKPDVKQALRAFGKEFLLDLLELQKPINLYTDEEYANLCRLTKLILNNKECYSIEHLAINGADLIELGVPKGFAVGKRLNFILDAVIYEFVSNDKIEIIRYLKEIYFPLNL